MINYLPKWMYHFAVPSAMNEYLLLHIFTAFDVVGALDFGHSNGWAAIYGVAQSRTGLKWLSSSSSNGCVEISHCWFNLSFSDDIWCGPYFHMFIHLSSVMRCLRPCFYQVYVFFLLSFKSSLQIWDNNPFLSVSENILLKQYFVLKYSLLTMLW